MDLLTPSDWTDYELIDTGNREKLERFGKFTLIRPEPQAVWPKSMTEEEWEKLSHARFSRGKTESPQSSVSSPQSAVGSPQSTVRSPQSADGNKQSPGAQSVLSPQHLGTTAPSFQSPATVHDSRFTIHEKKEERGYWGKKPGMPDQWMIGYDYKGMRLKFRLGLTAFGHIGVFPEQAENWKFIFDTLRAMSHEARGMKDEERKTKDELSGNPVIQSSSHPVSGIQDPASRIKVLNLFAYTGGASLAAKAAGADVVHVDSVKQVINWAREDMEISNLEGIRWVVEDALKFVRREVKRGNRYDGIILDPPAYGRGPEGEKWILEDSIDEIISLCAELLRAQGSGHRARDSVRSPQSSVPSPQSSVLSPQSPVASRQSPFLVLSLYSMGFSSLIGENLVRSHFSDIHELQSGELCFADRAGRRLPLGTYARLF